MTRNSNGGRSTVTATPPISEQDLRRAADSVLETAPGHRATIDARRTLSRLFAYLGLDPVRGWE